MKLSTMRSSPTDPTSASRPAPAPTTAGFSSFTSPAAATRSEAETLTSSLRSRDTLGGAAAGRGGAGAGAGVVGGGFPSIAAPWWCPVLSWNGIDRVNPPTTTTTTTPSPLRPPNQSPNSNHPQQNTHSTTGPTPTTTPTTHTHTQIRTTRPTSVRRRRRPFPSGELATPLVSRPHLPFPFHRRQPPSERGSNGRSLAGVLKAQVGHGDVARGGPRLAARYVSEWGEPLVAGR
jgi:hypothetical protein